MSHPPGRDRPVPDAAPDAAAQPAAARPDALGPDAPGPAAAGPGAAPGPAGADAAGQAAAGALIRVPGWPNVRDIGGYPAAGGATTRRGMLFRSGAPRQARPDDGSGRAILAALGLRTVVDLRSPREASRAPDPPGLAGRHEHIPLLDAAARGLPPTLEAVYRYIVTERGAAVTAVVRALAAAGARPALVHCSAGKDRTGIVIGLVLAVLGVPDEVIAADYALSAEYLAGAAAAIIGQVQESAGLAGQANREFLASPPALMHAVLGWARAAGGGTVDGYLLRHGLTRAGLDALRRALTADRPEPAR